MDTTRATTTTSERRRRRRLNPSGALLALLTLPLAALLLYLGGRHFASALLEARHQETVAAVERGARPPSSRLEAAIGDLRSALEWRESRETHLHLALLQQALSEEPERDEATRRLARERAIAHLRAGLAEAPMAPMAWSRLAALLLADHQPDEALLALRLSTLIAPYAPEQLWWRLSLWLRLQRQLAADDHPMLRRQLLLAFDREPARLSALASRHAALYRVRGALSAAGVAAERLDAHFPIPLTPRRR